MMVVTLRIDRRFKGVGRINRASGTTNPSLKRKIERMMRALYDEGRIDILRALRDGQLEFIDVYDAFQRRAIHELPIGPTLQPLAEAMTAWIETLLVPRDYAAKTVEAFGTSRDYFERHNGTARVADLPRVLEELRTTLGVKHPRSFNMCRSSALSFTRATLKRSHRLYIECAAVEARKVEKRAPRAQLTPAAMRGFFPNPDTDVVDGIAWAMVTTGMGAGEYWGAWEIQADRIHIDGTKSGGRVRDVPLARKPMVPRLSRDRFQRVFRERIKGAFTPYDLRRTYAQWLESAGVQRSRRRLYMGHASADTTDIYERHEVTAFLAEDAGKLTAFLKPKRAKSGASSPKSSAVG
jgi:integrase